MRRLSLCLFLVGACSSRAPGKAEMAAGDWRNAPMAGAAEEVEREYAPPTAKLDGDGVRRDFRETVHWSPSLRTGADGRATVSFQLSDAVTSFRATAEGLASGLPGRGEATIRSSLPLVVSAVLPSEVTRGDLVRLPVTVTNNTDRARDGVVEVAAGAAFALEGDARRVVQVPARRARTLQFPLRVVGERGGEVLLRVTSGTLEDRVAREIRVVPPGFPGERAISGTLTAEAAAEHELTLPETIDGTLDATLRLYPSAVATMVEGTEAIIREPYGCFEQASSANYPNVMVLSYLEENDAVAPEVAPRAAAALDSGYKRLTGYETGTKGYEWFGRAPAHEALTAYGLMQFQQMKRVYPSLDEKMVVRTTDWLKSRRDGKGGFARSDAAIDSFGRASKEVTDAYITWALTEVGERDLAAELAAAATRARASEDPYVLALSANALVNAKHADATAALDRLAKKQNKDGAFPGAAHSITMSGGDALAIETTALAAIALMKSSGREREAARAMDWIRSRRDAYGGFASTQATILALQALTMEAARSKMLPDGAAIRLTVNGFSREVALPAGAGQGGEPVVVEGLEEHLRPGLNTIAITTADGVKLPYSLGVTWRTERPVSDARAPISVAASLSSSRVRLGGPVKLRARVANKGDKGVPMAIARVGIPGGLSYQPWQLEELKKRGKVDFVETREREVILYWRGMAPREEKLVDLELLASVPGSYAGPISQAYLYYTDEHRRYADPLTVSIYKPKAKKKVVANATR